jgi:hypothetical protein
VYSDVTVASLVPVSFLSHNTLPSKSFPGAAVKLILFHSRRNRHVRPAPKTCNPITTICAVTERGATLLESDGHEDGAQWSGVLAPARSVWALAMTMELPVDTGTRAQVMRNGW